MAIATNHNAVDSKRRSPLRRLGRLRRAFLFTHLPIDILAHFVEHVALFVRSEHPTCELRHISIASASDCQDHAENSKGKSDHHLALTAAHPVTGALSSRADCSWLLSWAR